MNHAARRNFLFEVSKRGALLQLRDFGLMLLFFCILLRLFVPGAAALASALELNQQRGFAGEGFRTAFLFCEPMQNGWYSPLNRSPEIHLHAVMLSQA